MSATNSASLMPVGELSRRTGVPAEALRQYTDWGLIYTKGRSATNYRLFDADALWCVDMIGQLRALGLTVAEVRELTRTPASFGIRLAELLSVSRKRITSRVNDLATGAAPHGRIRSRAQRPQRRCSMARRSAKSVQRLTFTPGAGPTVAMTKVDALEGKTDDEP
ncbi:MerR family transcriptional regulator [Kibdelosporangium aridum]|uniref:MerR family transcriptional regulator n=1 Tax=Kibdelosporangium aridum TaxID=2030 RepID=UPI0035ED80A7